MITSQYVVSISYRTAMETPKGLLEFVKGYCGLLRSGKGGILPQGQGISVKFKLRQQTFRNQEHAFSKSFEP
jgi:hypothetical protein